MSGAAHLPSPAESASRKLHYIVVVPVWGDHHTDLFLRYHIPFLLTSGNVGGFPNRTLRFQIVSRRVDFARMREDRNYQRLGQLADLVETEIDPRIDLSVSHRAMTECYVQAISALAARDDVVTIFPTPDCVLSRNALVKIRIQMENGCRGIMVCGLRTTLESAGPQLDKILARPDGAERLGERQLTKITLENLHPISMTHDLGLDAFMCDWPSHIYWISPTRDWLVAHCLHLHPIAVRGVPARIDINTTIDGDYLTGFGVGAEEFQICRDSDEFLCIELSPRSKTLQAELKPFSESALLRFSIANCNLLHRKFFAHAIHWRTTSDTQIPRVVQSRANELNAIVVRGSIYEQIRLAGIRFVRRHAVLLLVARLLRRSVRWVFHRPHLA